MVDFALHFLLSGCAVIGALLLIVDWATLFILAGTICGDIIWCDFCTSYLFAVQLWCLRSAWWCSTPFCGCCVRLRWSVCGRRLYLDWPAGQKSSHSQSHAQLSRDLADQQSRMRVFAIAEWHHISKLRCLMPQNFPSQPYGNPSDMCKSGRPHSPGLLHLSSHRIPFCLCAHLSESRECSARHSASHTIYIDSKAHICASHIPDPDPQASVTPHHPLDQMPILAACPTHLPPHYCSSCAGARITRASASYIRARSALIRNPALSRCMTLRPRRPLCRYCAALLEPPTIE